MAKQNKDVKPIRDKKSLTIFLLMMPSLLMAMTSTITSTLIRFSFQLVLFVFQYVLVKNLIDSYEGY